MNGTWPSSASSRSVISDLSLRIITTLSQSRKCQSTALFLLHWALWCWSWMLIPKTSSRLSLQSLRRVYSERVALEISASLRKKNKELSLFWVKLQHANHHLRNPNTLPVLSVLCSLSSPLLPLGCNGLVKMKVDGSIHFFLPLSHCMLTLLMLML